MPEWDGPERRKDYIELDHALEQVSHLHGAVTTLATAMSNAAPKKELADLRTEVRRDYLTKIYFMAAFTVGALIILIFFINLQFNHMDSNIQRGHDVINCLQTKPEAQRTGDNAPTAVLLCKQTQKG